MCWESEQLTKAGDPVGIYSVSVVTMHLFLAYPNKLLNESEN